MAVATRAIIEGQVMSVDVRSGVSKKTGEPYSMTEVLVIGPDTLCVGTLAVGVPAPKPGDKVRARIEVGVYGGQDSARVLAWLA